MKIKKVYIVYLLLVISIILNLVSYQRNRIYTKTLSYEIKDNIDSFKISVKLVNDNLEKIENQGKYNNLDLINISDNYNCLLRAKYNLIAIGNNLGLIDYTNKSSSDSDVSFFLLRNLNMIEKDMDYKLDDKDRKAVLEIKKDIDIYLNILLSNDILVEDTYNQDPNTDYLNNMYFLRYRDSRWRSFIEMLSDNQRDKGLEKFIYYDYIMID